MRRSRLVVVGLSIALSSIATACSEKIEGLKPVGGEESTPAQKERYVRRLVLDLTGQPPSDALEAELMERLDTDGDGAEVRGAVADELMAGGAFAETWVAELENRVFAGEMPENRYALLCLVYRNDDPACQTCPDPSNGDLCSDCDCPMVTALRNERASLDSAAADFAAGSTSAEIERRYAGSYVFQLYGTAESTSMALFQTFLGRAASPDEVRNASMMVFADDTSTNPSGLLFHRHGRNYYDLVDIVFTSENYREAVVQQLFLRYLGRTPTATEQSVFAGRLDETSADARPVIRAVVSSREYFEQ